MHHETGHHISLKKAIYNSLLIKMSKSVLRKLKASDAAYMMEWMSDPEICRNFNKDFSSMTTDKCRQFIEESASDKKNKHLAVVNEEDQYLGTISIKHIDTEKANAEFAIVLRKCAHGRGYARRAVEELCEYASSEAGLKSLFLSVRKDNKRAIAFYDKCRWNPISYKELCGKCNIFMYYDNKKLNDLIWYEAVLDNEPCE